MSTERYNSQYYQDEFIDRYILSKKTNGVFIDIGAHDGIDLSNTYFFEKNRSYKGICIEPNPAVYKKLVQNRKCITVNAAIADVNGKLNYLQISGYAEMLSGIVDFYDPRHLERIECDLKQHGGTKDIIEIESCKLDSLIAKHNFSAIDYCSIDVEGAELNIIKSIDFSKVNIYCFSIENNYEDILISQHMVKNGYTHIGRLAGDDIYIKKSILPKELYLKWLLYQFKKRKNLI